MFEGLGLDLDLVVGVEFLCLLMKSTITLATCNITANTNMSMANKDNMLRQNSKNFIVWGSILKLYPFFLTKIAF